MQALPIQAPLPQGRQTVYRSRRVKRDLRYMITAGVQNNIPVVIGTAGGSGAAPHRWCREIIHEIAREEHLSFSMALIPADVDKAIVHQALDNGKITALDFVRR